MGQGEIGLKKAFSRCSVLRKEAIWAQVVSETRYVQRQAFSALRPALSPLAGESWRGV
jgi:hypothetical protein